MSGDILFGKNILPKEDIAKAYLILMRCSISLVLVGFVIDIFTLSVPEICGGT
jgi:hypothetical protein